MKQILDLSIYPTVKVGPKYQVVIPKKVREVVKGIKPGRKVLVGPVDEWSLNIQIKPTAEEWARATLGMDKKTWKKSNSTEYINQLRDEWEGRLSEIYS